MIRRSWQGSFETRDSNSAGLWCWTSRAGSLPVANRFALGSPHFKELSPLLRLFHFYLPVKHYTLERSGTAHLVLRLSIILGFCCVLVSSQT